MVFPGATSGVCGAPGGKLCAGGGGAAVGKRGKPSGTAQPSEENLADKRPNASSRDDARATIG